ncbi:MAG: HmuY family protein [Chitinophagaceae bacterium]
MNNYKIKGILFFITAIVMMAACRKRDAELPGLLVNFENSSQGITTGESFLEQRLVLSRVAEEDISISLKLSEQGVVHGTDYTTEPVAVSGNINLVIPAGSNAVSFRISKVNGILFDGDEKIFFDINSTGIPSQPGIKKQLTVGFEELIAKDATAVINGGGLLYPNKVFIDLSASRETPVVRTAWDLGFYTGTDDFRVVLNSSSAMMAKQINKNDLTQVTAADTIGFSSDVAFSLFSPTTTSLPYIDYPTGDLTKTAIASVSSIESNNKVYIVNRGLGIGSPASARGWKKIRIIRNATGGYILEQADIAASTFTSIDIPKDEAYFFKYVSFENGIVMVEPQKKKWDIAWSYFSNVTNFGAGEVPYLYQDFILINRNVQAAKVITGSIPFSTFDSTHIGTVAFSSGQNVIGADWRSGGGPTSGPAVRTDRYYIIKDGVGNYYKIRFTSLTKNGERGYPAYEVILVKKG